MVTETDHSSELQMGNESIEAKEEIIEDVKLHSDIVVKEEPIPINKQQLQLNTVEVDPEIVETLRQEAPYEYNDQTGPKFIIFGKNLYKRIDNGEYDQVITSGRDRGIVVPKTAVCQRIVKNTGNNLTSRYKDQLNKVYLSGKKSPTTSNKIRNNYQLNSITGNMMSFDQHQLLHQKAKPTPKKPKPSPKKPKIYTCQECGKVCKTKSSWYYHVQCHAAIEQRKNSFRESLETLALNEQKKENNKEEIHKGEFRCKVCNTLCQNWLNFVKHKKECDSTLLVCKYCQCQYDSYQSLRTHIVYCKLKYENKETYECTCGKIYLRKTKMIFCQRRHEKAQMDQTEKKCARCLKVFQQGHSFDSHNWTHLAKMKKCNFCPVEYSDQNCLVMHVLIHQRLKKLEYKIVSDMEKGKLLVCFECKDVFKDLRTLKDHIKCHVTPYECEHCKQKCPDINQLLSHMKSNHESIDNTVINALKTFWDLTKDWKCEICQIKFDDIMEFSLHKTNVHNPSDFDILDRIKCQDCYRVFPSIFTYKKHRLTQHQNQIVDETRICVYCKSMCRTDKGYIAHSIVHSTDRKLICKYCGYKFITKASFEGHKKKTHNHDPKYVCLICDYHCETEDQYETHKNSLDHCTTEKSLLECQIEKHEMYIPSSIVDSSIPDSAITDSSHCINIRVKPSSEQLMFECDICMQKFPTESEMNSHKEIHPFITFPDQTDRIFFK